MTPAFFVFTNGVAVAFTAYVAFWASRSLPRGGWMVLLMGVQRALRQRTPPRQGFGEKSLHILWLRP
jgi:hypothetical protein